MNLFHHAKFECDQDGEKFKSYDELIQHARHVHHHPIVKCHNCGKEFIHEKDRLHHEREEHEKVVDYRLHKNMARRLPHKRKYMIIPVILGITFEVVFIKRLRFHIKSRYIITRLIHVTSKSRAYVNVGLL